MYFIEIFVLENKGNQTLNTKSFKILLGFTEEYKTIQQISRNMSKKIYFQKILKDFNDINDILCDCKIFEGISGIFQKISK